MDFNYDTETITPEQTGMITIGGVQGLEIPAGTSAERPVSPIIGTVRLNTDVSTAVFEYWDGSSWTSPGGSGTVTSVAAAQPAAGLTISGSPITSSGTLTFALANDLAAVEGLATTGIVRRTATDTWTAGGNVNLTTEVTGVLPIVNGGTNLSTVPANGQLLIGNGTGYTLSTLSQGAGTTITNGAGTITIAANVTSVFGRTGAVVATEGDYNLTQLGDVTITTPTNGQILRYNGTQWVNGTDFVGTVTSVAATQPTAGLTITGSPITTTGTLTFALANDLGAIEALNGTGFYTRTGTDTWAARTITGTANQITVTNGAGTAGNPTIAIAANPVLPGTGGYVVPTGTTAERPVSPANGTLRYNTTTNKFEAFEDGIWITLNGTTTGRGIINIYTGIIPASSGTSQVPWDNTQPLVTEGSEIWTFTVTPTKLTSEFKLTVPFTNDASTNNRVVVTSIFRNSTNIGSAIFFTTGGGRPSTTTLSVSDTPNTTSPVTYSMRTGISVGSGGVWYINSTSSGNDLGGTLVSTWQITEVA